MKNNIISLGIANLSKELQNGLFTSSEVTETYLDAIRIKDKTLNAFINTLSESARLDARDSTRRWKNGKELSPIDGIPIALKDNINVSKTATTGGIEAYRHQIATYDAHIVTLLRKAGAIILGKLNMHEAAYGATTENEAYGNCNNPHHIGYTPGGSSGGAGSAVAAGLCAGAIGTDTLGSIRIPSSFCGVVGFKPTFGRVSNHGIMNLCSTLDHAGPITRSIEDASLLLEVISKFDDRDLECKVMEPYLHARINELKSLSNITIGFIDNPTITQLNMDIQLAYNQAILSLSSMNANTIEVNINNYLPEKLIPMAMLISGTELYNSHKDTIENNKEGFSNSFLDKINYIKKQSASKLSHAIKNIKKVNIYTRKIFQNIDVLILPTTPTTAFSFNESIPKNIAYFTALANFNGCPALSLPTENSSGIHSAKGLPIGIQVITAPGNDSLALQVGMILEKLSNWKPSHYNNNFCKF